MKKKKNLNSIERKDFGGYDYECILAYFKYTLLNTDDVRNEETRQQWFERCHDVGLREFAEIVRKVESRAEFLRIMDIKKRADMGRTDQPK